MASTQIKKIDYARAASLSDRKKSVSILSKKKEMTGILWSKKGPEKKAHKHHVTQRYCALCKKSGIPERKYMLHSAKDCTGMHTIKDGMEGYVRSRADTVKQHKISGNKWKKYLKDLRNKKNMLYSISKKSCSRREIRKIRAKASKKGCQYSNNYSSDKYDSDSLLARDSSWDTYGRPAGRKDMNTFDHVVTKNLKKNKYQSNEAIQNDPTFDNNSFNLYSGTRDPLPLVNISLWGGKKHRETTVSGLTCLWDSGSINIMIQIKHTKHYERKMRSNKLEYNTDASV